MDIAKKRRLHAGGWTVGDASELLELTTAQAAYIEVRLELAACFRSLRVESGVTQAQAAQRLGSSQSRIAKLEAADPSVSLDLMVKALLSLGATPQDISRAIDLVA